VARSPPGNIHILFLLAVLSIVIAIFLTIASILFCDREILRLGLLGYLFLVARPLLVAARLFGHRGRRIEIDV
jgi:hypothetical protein